MTTDVIDAEVVSRELVPMDDRTVALPVSVDEALRQWKDYQDLTELLLNDSDYQRIGTTRFKKKSAWRKYARAFNITDRVTFEHIERAEDGFPLWARIRVEARATNGRTAEADHECHIGERCCAQPCPKRNWNDHYCCPADCNGRKHWSHPGDLPATALTRAKNRAISDLIGAGEVSAEEMTEKHVAEKGETESRAERVERVQQGHTERTTARKAAKPATPAATPDIQKPLCPEHQVDCDYVPEGTSAKTGKKYGAFYSCPKRDCTAGNGGRRFSIFLDAWTDILSQQANENAPQEEGHDFHDLPNEQ